MTIMTKMSSFKIRETLWANYSGKVVAGNIVISNGLFVQNHAPLKANDVSVFLIQQDSLFKSRIHIRQVGQFRDDLNISYRPLLIY